MSKLVFLTRIPNSSRVPSTTKPVSKKQQQKRSRPAKQKKKGGVGQRFISSSNTRPSASSTTMTGSAPALHISRREFIGSFQTTGTAFAIDPLTANTPGYDLSPANSVMFPWLSGIADHYEKFRFNRVTFDVVQGNPTTASGRYYIAFDYDWDDPVPTTKGQVMQTDGVIDAPVYMNSSLKLDPRKLNADMPYRFVSATNRVNGVEPRTACAGFLIFAAEGTANLSYDLFIDYDLELIIPAPDTSGVQVFPPAVPILPTTANKAWLGLATPTAGPGIIAIPGSLGCPTLINGTAAIIGQPPTVLDIRDVRGSVLAGIMRWAKAAVAPSALDLSTQMGGELYDSGGSYIGQVNNTTNPQALVSPAATGVENSSTLATPGAYVNSVATFAMDQVMAAFPTARYFAPILFTSGTNFVTGLLASASAKLKY